MAGFIKKQLIFTGLILLAGLFFTNYANAASLISISDTTTTSRPSASAPIVGNQAAAAGQVTITDNGSTFLASDSAVFWPDTGETLNTVNVASMSAANIPAASQRIVYFTNTAANTHHAGDPITTAITAKHTIVFTTVSTIPNGGKIVITFPGSGVNTASPSATTFAFNSLAAANVSFSGTSACPTGQLTISAPTITCTTNASIAGATTITVTVGSSTPALINPTKTTANICNAGQSTCTADIWKISIQTQDTPGNGSTVLDSGSAKIATVEAVQVQATVEPTLTFTIAGIADATTINTNNTNCTGNTDVTNTGIGSTATTVNLGILSNGKISMSAQDLTVSTNGSQGYSITATSSGHLINPASGFWLPDANGGNGLTANDTPAPAALTAGTAAFGIHPCGARVPTGTGPAWQTGTTGGGTGARYSNPYNTGTNAFYATVASYTGGAVTSDKTSVEYAGTVSGTTPPGIYTTIYTYVATATF